MHRKKYIEMAVEKAISEARKSPIMHKHGCVIVKIKGDNKGAFLSYGHNVTTYEISRSIDKNNKINVTTRNIFNNVCSIHAEMSVLYKINRSLIKDCLVVVVRINKHGKTVNSKPCKDCQEVLKRWNITLYYSS